MIFGIDYGSKVAGTTAIAYQTASLISIEQSLKGKDADAFILERVAEHKPSHIFLDAPLSLPLVYRYPDSQDYFYRKADRELKAMSPMFIGGLTARAMRLTRILNQQKVKVMETYPGGLISHELKIDSYKSDLEKFGNELGVFLTEYNIRNFPSLANWHQADAMLALLSGFRFSRNHHLSFGDELEGLIIL